VVWSPALPYGLQRNFYVATLLPLDPQPEGVRDHQERRTDEPLRVSSAADFGCTRDPALAVARGWNVVLYVLESTAMEQTSLGASNADTTPFLRSLVEQGAAATPCYAQVANSAKATFTLFSGLYACSAMEILECEVERTPGLARVLGERGYATALVSPQTLFYQGQRTMFRRMGFEQIVGFAELGELARARGRELPENGPGANDDRSMLLFDHAELARREPFFLACYTQSTHFPYQHPGGGAGSDQERHRAALRYADAALRELVELHRALGVFERTLYVITADHGEDFREGRFAPRNSSLAENGHRTPLCIFAPGVDLRRRPLPVARQVDILPSVLDLLGLALEGVPLQGRSLFDGGPAPRVFLASYGPERVFGLIEGREKWGLDVAARALRVTSTARDDWRAVSADEHASIVRRMQEFDTYNEALLRDLVSAGGFAELQR
jgi:phosphoglycerol transferase MdoB-like AlkP superfamily enzyme